jgi:hypothetical protein
MFNRNDLRSVSDDDLLRRLTDLLKQSRRVESDLVAHIGEVDARRLYSRHSSSMFTYCTEVLHLSEAEAYLRIAAARASRKYPQLLSMLSDGRIHLSGIGKLATYLTDANCEEVLARAAHNTKRETEELVAELVPKPDVPASLRKLPETPNPPPMLQLRPDAVKNETPPQRAPAPPAVQPLAPARYKVTFTATAELRDKIERLEALLNMDIAAIIETAVTEKLERLEARRFGMTKAPRTNLDETETSGASRYIPAAVRRVVFERDERQCTFVDSLGTRCTERHRLEFHHDDPYGLGGDHDPRNIHLACRAHNAYFAERVYGKETMDRFREVRV